MLNNMPKKAKEKAIIWETIKIKNIIIQTSFDFNISLNFPIN